MKKLYKKLLPFKAYTLPFFLLALAGLFDSLYLAISHYHTYTDISYNSFCALSKAINCDTVAESPWSILFGIPLAQWGILAYALIIIITLPAIKDTPSRRTVWYVLFFLTALYSLVDLYFGYISAVKIHAYCILCLLSYSFTFGLLFSSWIICRRFNSGSFIIGFGRGIISVWKSKITLVFIGFIFVLFCCVKIFLPNYWLYELPPLSKNVATGFTEDHHPWIGATDPSVIIEEFTDYQCFQCSKTHYLLRHLINQHPGKIRLIHRHYPLDEQFNPMLVKTQIHAGSGQMALLAIAAGKQNQFWRANDFLYSIARQKLKEFNIDKFSNKLGLESDKTRNDIYAPDTFKLLERDIREGLKNKITATPSFIINGKVYQGNIPQDMLETLLQ